MKEESKNLPQNLFHSFDNDYSRDALIQMSDSLLESATQSLLDSDVMTKIPIVGGLVALGKGVLNFRDRQFVSKLLRVLAETSSVNPERQRAFKEELDKNPKVANKSGAILLDLIDKATGAEKASMIGKVIRAKMEENFSYDELIGLCEMIDKAYLSDLRALARKDGESGSAWNDVNLEGVGIKKPMRTEEINDAIKASMSVLERQMPIAREKPLPITLKKPKVLESGLTDAGAMLRRILSSY